MKAAATCWFSVTSTTCASGSGFTTEQQEQIIGHTKQDSEELPPEQRPDTSHVSRVDLKEDGKGLKILRLGLALWHR